MLPNLFAIRFRRSNLKRITFFLLLLYANGYLRAAHFTYTPNLVEAQKYLVELKLKKAAQLINLELQQHPENVAASYLNQYVAFYQIMIHQNQEYLSSFEKTKIKTIEQIRLLPEKSPDRLYLLGSTHIQGAFAKSLFNEYLSAGLEFRTAYGFLEQNQKKFPNYLTNLKDLGALKALLGTFPDSYKWIVAAIGLKGSLEEGCKMLFQYTTVSQKEPLIEQQQAAIFYALIQLNFGSEKQLAWAFYQKHSTDYTHNLMQNYVRAYVASKCGKNEEAIKVLKAKPIHSDYEHIPYMDYLMGNSLLNKLDLNASIYYKKYISFSYSKNSLKDSYLKLAWCEWLLKDTAKYMVYLNLMKKTGKELGSEEKLLFLDLSKGNYPNVNLIKARLLFDGGYLNESERLLEELKNVDYLSIFQKVEYHYRRARVSQELKDFGIAILEYQKAIDLAKGMDTYMAPNACLQLAIIFQNLHYLEKAKQYAEKISEYDNYDYETSIQQKAKSILINLK